MCASKIYMQWWNIVKIISIDPWLLLKIAYDEISTFVMHSNIDILKVVYTLWTVQKAFLAIWKLLAIYNIVMLFYPRDIL